MAVALVQYKDTGQRLNVAASTTHSLTFDQTAGSGRFLLAVCTIASGVTPTCTPTSGWSTLTSISEINGFGKVHIFYKSVRLPGGSYSRTKISPSLGLWRNRLTSSVWP